MYIYIYIYGMYHIYSMAGVLMYTKHDKCQSIYFFSKLLLGQRVIFRIVVTGRSGNE